MKAFNQHKFKTKSKMENFIISKAQVEALLQYLQTKPFMEVAGAMDFLTKLPTAKIIEDKKEVKK